MPPWVKPALVLVGDWMPNAAMPSASVALRVPVWTAKVSVAPVSARLMSAGGVMVGAGLRPLTRTPLTVSAMFRLLSAPRSQLSAAARL